MPMKKAQPSEKDAVVLYARVSDQRQAEKNLSIPAQLRALREYARAKGYTVADEYIEPGKSATDDQRPAFQKMMADVSAPSARIREILVVYTSRFMRDVGRARAWKSRLRKIGVRVVAINQETSDDAGGRMAEGFFELFDQYESDMNSTRTYAAVRENARNGFVNFARAPLGFTVEKRQVGSNVRRQLVPNPAEIETVLACLRSYIDEGGALRASRVLRQRGLSHRGHPFTKDRVLAVVSETALVGTYYWGRRDSRTGQHRPKEEWIEIPVTPIVPRELFDLAQRVRDERDPEKSPGRTPSSPLLLAGIMRCGRCGDAYTLETAQPRGRSAGYAYRYANCRVTKRSGKDVCAGFRIRLDVLEDAIKRYLVGSLFSTDRVEQLAIQLRRMREKEGDQRSQQRKTVERDLRDVERRLRTQMEAFEDGNGDPAFRERITELSTRRVELRALLEPVAAPQATKAISRAALLRFRDRLREIFLQDERQIAKTYVRALLESVVIFEDRLQLTARADVAMELLKKNAAPDLSSAAFSPLRTAGLQLLDSNQRPGD